MCNQNSLRRLEKSIALSLTAALVLTSVPGQAAKASKKKAVQSIQITAPYSVKGKKVTSSLSMKKGSSFRIKVQVSPKSAKKTDKLIYKSSKKKIATVSKKGVISAKKLGKTKITVKSKKNKKIKATITVTVVKALKKVKKLKMNKESLSFTLGSGRISDKLKVTIVSPKKPTTKKLNWYSTNKKIVSVNKKGIVTAKKAGNAQIVVTAADGRGAKATCKVTVSKDSGKNSPVPSRTPSKSPSVTSGVTPTTKPSPSPTPVTDLTIQIPGNRTGIKQGESLQLTAAGLGADKVSWSVSNIAGVTINATGLLSVASTVEAGKKIAVTATTSADVKVKTSMASFTVIENQITKLPDNLLQLNQETPETPLGLTYRSKQAYSTVQDPERGEVIRFDSSKGYTANSYDVLAWMEVDPMYAGKTVTVSCYMKYEDDPKLGKKLNLLIQERGKYTKLAAKYDAEPDTWYYLTGSYTFPDRIYTNENQNRLYITRDTQLPDGVNAVYYIDDLRFTIEKANVESVNLTAANDDTTIYQNHELQFSSEVIGTNKPIQKVSYSITSEVKGASIDENGLLKVGNVPKDTKITVKAASIEDPEKYATKEITVLAQTIDSITVTAKDSPEYIDQGTSLQFNAAVTATGEPNTNVAWSVSPEISGVTISKTGLLEADKTAKIGTELTVKATSVFDSLKFATYKITIRGNAVNSVTIKTGGGKKIVSSDISRSLEAQLDIEGSPETGIKWSVEPNKGATLAFTEGNYNALSIDSSIVAGTSVTVRASSVFDETKYDEVTLTVQEPSNEFDINRPTIKYFEDFDSENKKLDSVKKDGIFSWKVTELDNEAFCPGFNSNLINIYQRTGISNLSDIERPNNAYKGFFGGTDDYIQFSLNNATNKESEYTISFFFRFFDIDADSEYIEVKMKKDTSFVKYKLPLKLISLDENGQETILKDNIQIPFRCSRYPSDNPEYYEITSSISIPANKTVNIRLMLDGELPTCLSPDHEDEDETYADTPHPCTFTIDNIAISSGKLPTLTLKAGDTYQLELDTVDGDTVKYYTNSYLAQYTHGTSDTCTRFDTTVATVDDNGKITANASGDTALIAEITHTNGEVERRQCIVHVD